MSESLPPSDPPASQARAQRARKWRKRLVRLTVLLIILAFLVRAMVQVLFPPVLRKVAHTFGLNASYDRLELYLMGGDVGLWGLRFTPIAGGEPVLTVAYCRASISELGLLRGKLGANRVEAEGTDLVVERSADGQIPLIAQFLGPATATTPAPTTAKKPLSLDSPLTIDVARLQDATLHFRDQSVSPPADVSLNLDALITDFGSSQKRSHFDIALHSPQALAALYVSGSGQTRDNILDADLSLRMYGLNLTPADEYLTPFGIKPISGNLTATATGKLQARVTGPASNLSATLDLTNLTLQSDSRESAAADRLLIDASSLSLDAIQINQILIDGVRAVATRTDQGRLRFAGIEFVGLPSSPRPPPPSPSSPLHLPTIDLKQLLVQNANFTFADSGVAPQAMLALQVPHLAVENFRTDTAAATVPATLHLSASAPGIARSIVVEGSATSRQGSTSLAISVNIDGINPQAADPYLAAARLSRKITDARFTCNLTGSLEPKPDGSLAASLNVTDSTLTDGDRQLLSMPLIGFQNATIGSGASGITVESVSIVGPILPALSQPNGIIQLLGLQYDPAAQLPPTVPRTQPPVIFPSISLPAIAISKFTWRGAALHLNSASADQPLDLSIQDFRIDGDNLIFNSTGPTTTPGNLKISLKSPGLVEDFSIDGKLATSDRSVAFDLHGQSTGISARNLKPLLNTFGIDPDLNAGALTFTTKGKVTQSTDRVSADLSIGNVRFSDGDVNWLSMDNLAVAGASFDGKTLQVDSIQLNQPAAQVMRDQNGLFALAGMKLLPPKSVPLVTTAPTAPPQTRLDLSLPIVVKISSFQMHDAAVRLTDADVLPAADATAKVSVSASDLLAGADGDPAKFSLTLASPGAIDSLVVDGRLKLAPADQEISLTAQGRGISAKTLEPYFPPNVTTHMTDGQFAATLSASIEPNPAGGSRAKLSVTDLSLQDDPAAPPVASLGSLRLGVDRLDLAGQRIDISEIALDHATLAVQQNDAGLFLLGLTISPHPVRPTHPSPPEAEPLAPVQASNVAALVAQAGEHGPLITVDKLSIGVDRISFIAPALAEPFALTNLSLTNVSSIQLLGDEPTRHPPIDLHLRGGAGDLIDSIAIDVRLAPFAAEPFANLNFNITGIHGNQITALAPQLKETLDGSDLTDGRFTTSIESHFAYTHRGALGVDLTRNITSEFEVKNIKLSQSDKTLAGLDNIHGDGVRFSPATGSLTVKSLDITKPSAIVVRDAKGIHLLGLTVHVPPTTRPTTAAAPTAQKSQPSVAIASPPPAPGKAEYRIDRLTISGADFAIEDRVAEPITSLPIKDLDVDVKGLSSLALVEPDKPIRFSVLVGAGKVPLPPRQPTPGVQTEQRDLFAEATASGNVTLVPKPQGFVKASLSGLELNSIRGLAKQFGITLGGATFDVRVDVRMNGADSFDAHLYPTFNELRLSEEPNGPLQRVLKLPVSPDVVIAALEDQDGSISFPLPVPIQAGHLEWEPIVASATGSLGAVLASAMVAAPLKVANLLPLGGDSESARIKAIPPIVIDFAPGESQLTTAQLNQIQSVVLAMRRDRSLACVIQQTLGQADLNLVDQRANPLSSDILSIAVDLRQRKLELQRTLTTLTGQATAALASQNADAAQTTIDSLRTTSAQLKETEDALDQALDLLRPGAARQSQRRMKTSAILLASLRLQTVKDALDRAAIPNTADRIQKGTAIFNPQTSSTPGRVTIALIRRSNG